MWTLGLGKRDSRLPAERERVKALVVAALGHNDDIGVSVSEIVCADPACPGTETVILVMAPLRKTAACKVAKPMREVTDDDVRDALCRLAYTP